MKTKKLADLIALVRQLRVGSDTIADDPVIACILRKKELQCEEDSEQQKPFVGDSISGGGPVRSDTLFTERVSKAPQITEVEKQLPR